MDRVMAYEASDRGSTPLARAILWVLEVWLKPSGLIPDRDKKGVYAGLAQLVSAYALQA